MRVRRRTGREKNYLNPKWKVRREGRGETLAPSFLMRAKKKKKRRKRMVKREKRDGQGKNLYT